MSAPDHNANYTKDAQRAVKIWADGCYDVGHFGHANSLRQAKALGTHLTVGVHSDEEINEHKGPPLFNEHERYQMIKAMRWVDDVVEDAPYVTTVETLDLHGCKYCAHGDDITTDVDGNDTYQEVKDAGRYLEVNRTLGVSTTDIINRMLRFGKAAESDASLKNQHKNEESSASASASESASASVNASPWTGSTSKFMLTTQKLSAFGSGKKIENAQKVVLAFGCFDVFNLAHVKFLDFAKKQGDFLLVGVYSDSGVQEVMGEGLPIMTLHERIMSVLACKYVDDVIIGFPTDMSQRKQILKEFGISKVVYPPPCKDAPFNVIHVKDESQNQMFVAEDIGDPDDTTLEIIGRVGDRRAEFEERNAKKEKKENDLIAAAKIRQQQEVNETPSSSEVKDGQSDIRGSEEVIATY